LLATRIQLENGKSFVGLLESWWLVAIGPFAEQWFENFWRAVAEHELMHKKG
jgi:hypothetical protein